LAREPVRALPLPVLSVAPTKQQRTLFFAAAGHWQRALSAAGIDIVAYDNGSDPPLTSSRQPVGVVQPGDASVLAQHPRHTLLLVYPPRGDMADQCLAAYKGRTIVYVGEGEGGSNGSPTFFATLKSSWRCVHIEALEPFPGGHEHLYVFERR
jgi:hypothetical protein